VTTKDQDVNIMTHTAPTTFPPSFLWGASTAPHQIEGGNVGSDFWANEGRVPGMERSGDACDSYHRYTEDMQLLADAGCNAYRFGIEWARIEPAEGLFSNAELAHYRRMIDTALDLGLTPVVTLHHFTNPRWFAERGGWLADDAVDLFTRYVEQVTRILEGVEWVVTMNEPNMLSMMTALARDMARKVTVTSTEPAAGEDGAEGFLLAVPEVGGQDLDLGPRGELADRAEHPDEGSRAEVGQEPSQRHSPDAHCSSPVTGHLGCTCASASKDASPC
jgi:hypothetical protein